jgi:hypothetical protein
MPDESNSERITELQSFHWRTLEKLAHSLDLEKPDELSWSEFAPAIAWAEQEREPKPEESKPDPVCELNLGSDEPEPESVQTDTEIAVLVEPSKNKYPTEWYRASGIPYCEVCGEKYLNDSRGPICPESRSNCPRRA